MRKPIRNTLRKARRKAIWKLVKKKFGQEPVENLTVDQYDKPFTIFKQEDEDERYDRHMNPIRKAQEKTVSEILQDNLEPINKHSS